jgi:hypothetical protein
MRNIKSSKRQGLALLLISFDKAGIEALSSAVFFIILFTLWVYYVSNSLRDNLDTLNN